MIEVVMKMLRITSSHRVFGGVKVLKVSMNQRLKIN